MSQYGEKVHPFWHIPKFKDVTFDYAYSYQKNLVIPLEKQYKEKRSGRIAIYVPVIEIVGFRLIGQNTMPVIWLFDMFVKGQF